MIDPTQLTNVEDRKVGQTNSSLYITIPRTIAEDLHINKGDHLMIGESDGKAVLVPAKQREDKLETLARIQRLIAENKDALDDLANR